MKKLLLLLSLVPFLVKGQGVIDLNTGFGSNNGIIDLSRSSSLPILMSWVNYEGLSVTDTLLTDLSGNGNDWKLVNSNCLRLNGVVNISQYPDTTYINICDTFIFDWYFSMERDVAVMIAGGGGTQYIQALTSAYGGIRIRTTKSGTKNWNNVSAIQDSAIRHFRIVGRPDSIFVYNLTDGISQGTSNSFSCPDSLTIVRLGDSQSSTYRLVGKLFQFYARDDNDTMLIPLQEGKGSAVFDIINGRQWIINSYTGIHKNFWKHQNLVHQNLYGGFSRYHIYYGGDYNEDSLIYVPLTYYGDTISAVIANYKRYIDCPGGEWHNSAETGLQAPVSLIPYDVNNFLFDEFGEPNTIYYDNMTEDIGLEHKILIDVTTSYKYKDIRVYNKSIE